MSEKTRVLITGANGFVGRYLLNHLSRSDEFEIVAVVRRRSDNNDPENDNLKNAHEVIEVGEYIDFGDWDQILQSIDSVIHVAGIVSAEHLPPEQRTDYMLRVNRDITALITEKCIASNVSQLIYLSSMSVYGNGKDRLLTSETEVNFDDDYPASKYAGEVELRKIAAQNGTDQNNFNYVIVRPPMVVGPGTKGTFYSMVKMFAKIGFSPFGSIRSEYPIVKLDTLADFIYAAMRFRPIENGIYLVGEPEEYSVPEIMSLVARNEGKTLRHLPCPKGLLRFGLKMIGKQEAFDHLASGLRIDASKATELIGRLPDRD